MSARPTIKSVAVAFAVTFPLLAAMMLVFMGAPQANATETTDASPAAICESNPEHPFCGSCGKEMFSNSTIERCRQEATSKTGCVVVAIVDNDTGDIYGK